MMTSPLATVSLRRMDELRPNPFNPRGAVAPEDVQELASSIRTLGVLEPLLVTPEGLIVAGHRRHAAALLAGLVEVPVMVRTLTEAEQLAIMLAENIQRSNLSPLAEAKGLRDLMAQGVSLADVQRQVGVTAPMVRNRLDILRLAPAVQALYGQSLLPLGLVDVLVTIKDAARQEQIARLASERGLSVEHLRNLVKQGDRRLAASPPVPPAAPYRRGVGPTRDEVLHRLLDTPGQTVTFAQLEGATEALCCACGVHAERQEVCRECPVPKLLTLVHQLARPKGGAGARK